MSFNNSFDKLLNRVSELEERVDKLSSNEILKEESGVSIFKKQSLNSKNQLFFKIKIKFYIYLNKEFQFKLFADKILLTQDISDYKNGLNEITLFANYQNSVSDTIILELLIKAKNGTELIINETLLSVWGISINSAEDYEALMFGDQIFLSYINNDRLYYKIFSKNDDCETQDFVFLDNAKSHSVCYDNNSLILFRIDKGGSLFFSKLFETETFISSNVSDVSCCYFNDRIVFTYTTNGKVFIGEIYKNVISNNQLSNPHGYFTKCHLYYNKFNNKCYLLLTKLDNSNYLLENLDNSFHSSENICAEISLNILNKQVG